MVAEYSIIGTRVPRIGGRDQVTGKALFSTDIMLPNMLYGKTLRSPYPHAKILNINTSKAAKLPGVKAVVTGEDTPKRLTWGFDINDEPVFAWDNRVRYVGQEVAAVAAIDEDIADEALDLIEVEYEELPAVFDPIEAMKPDAPQLHEEMPEVANNVACEIHIERGDIEQGFAEADIIVEDKFVSARVNQCYMEPIGCTAQFDGAGKLTLWSGTMWPFLVREITAYALDIPIGNVRVVQNYVGGAFGSRSTILPVHFTATMLAQKTGRPVKVILTRDEEFLTTRHRFSSIMECKYGAKKDGTITAKQTRAINDNGAYQYLAPQMLSAMAVRGDQNYRFKNISFIGKNIYTNKTPVGSFRGFGNSKATFARESMLDLVAEKLGMDPRELRLKNCARPGDISPHGWKLNTCGISNCIELTTEKADWKKKRTEKKYGRGIGMASQCHESDLRQVSEGFGGSVIFIKLLEDGRIQLVVGEAEYGQGGHTSCAMAACEVLGVPWGKAEVVPVDTDVVPYSLGPIGSKLTITSVTATKLAADDLKRQIIEEAARMLKVKTDDLTMEKGEVFVTLQPDKRLTLADIGREAISKRGGSMLIGKGVDERDTENTITVHHKTHYGNPCSATYYDTTVAEVEVDTTTGDVKVLKLTIADDCGKVINLMGIEGQVQGGTLMGLGAAFSEQRIVEDGRVLNSSFRSYLLPSVQNIVPIDLIWVETNEPAGAFGCKGGGESPGINSCIPAIANAIYDAVGVRIKTLPITPDKILKALAEKNADSSR